MIPVHGLRSCVIRGKRQHKIVVIPGQQPVQIGRPAANILIRRKAVGHPKLVRRPGHQLHQPLRSRSAGRADIAAALRLDDARQQVFVHVSLGSGLGQKLVQITGSQFGLRLCEVWGNR